MREKRIRSSKKWFFVIAGLVVIGVASVMAWQNLQDQKEQSPTAAHPSLINSSTLSNLATTDTSIDRTHLAKGLTPPTNKWFSGFALQKEPKPGYNYPNSFKPLADGFEFSLPKVSASQKVITGTHVADIITQIKGSDSYKITYYDELVVELTYFDNSEQAVATVRVASGLPYVYLNAKQDLSVSFSGNATPKDSWTSIRSNDTNYGVNVSASENRFSLASGSHATFFSAPAENALETVVAQAGSIVRTASVSYERRDDNFITTVKYTTQQDRPLLFARLPHQQADDNTTEVTYRSILGHMTTEVGKEFSFTTPAVPVTRALDISDITQQQRDLLAGQLRKDISDFEPKQDTYFGGKQLYRMAQLLTIAKQLEADDLATSAQTTLKRELESWLKLGKSSPKSFLYDPSMRGVVGNEASFGSDKEFNDHHFHYGYFIYAAAILAGHDKKFLDTHKDTINLLVADIANYNLDEKLPLRRSFDPYAGHSWASGIVPFADGNNQESTSEAINAWVGVSLWARQIGNSQLETQANWMLSQETHTAKSYWLLLSGIQPDYLVGYTSPIAAIVWGGKREYATFFSDEANAKLAIQLIPLSPTIKKIYHPLPETVLKGTSTDNTYGDYILMADPDATLEKAAKLPDSVIDQGNSRTYMYAYILAK